MATEDKEAVMATGDREVVSTEDKKVATEDKEVVMAMGDREVAIRCFLVLLFSDTQSSD